MYIKLILYFNIIFYSIKKKNIFLYSNLREFGSKLSVIAAPLREVSCDSRHSRRSNATFLEVYSVSPPPARICSVLGSKSCSPSGLAHRCSPDIGFSRLDRLSGTPDLKTLQFYSTFRVHVSRIVVKPTQTPNCALRKVILSFSLRFCSAFKKYYKNPAKLKKRSGKRDTLHACSHDNRFFF